MLPASRILHYKTAAGLASSIGNICMVIRDLFTRTFPKDAFKRIYVDTKMQQLDMEKTSIIKKQAPILIIRPRFSIGDETMFGKLPDWMCTKYFVFKRLEGNYIPVMRDPVEELFIYASPDRLRVDFNIEIITLSRMQQLNYAYWWKGAYRHLSPFYLNDVTMETEFPKYFVKVIGDRMGFNYKERHGKKQLEDYLTDYSQSRVIDKIKTSSGNPTWFYTYTSNILCKTEGYPEVDDGRDVNLTKDFFKISANLVTEFWCPVNYFLEMKEKRPFVPPPREERNLTDKGMELIYNYSFTYRIPEKKELKTMQIAKSYICDSDEEDELDFSIALTDATSQALDIMLEKGYKIEDYLSIDIYRQDLIIPEEFISIDWKNRKLVNTYPEKNTAYTLILYADMERINKIRYSIDKQADVIYTK